MCWSALPGGSAHRAETPVSRHSESGGITVDAKLDLEIGLDRNEPRKAVEQFEQFALEHDLPMGLTFKFQLALDELLTNVVSYAFEEDAVAPVITLALHLTDDKLEAHLQDNGRPFNPLRDAPVPDLGPFRRGPPRGRTRHSPHQGVRPRARL